MSKQKILVTGGAGYIGAMLVEKLLQKKHQVRVLDNLIFGRKPIDIFKNKIELVNDDIRFFDQSVLNDIDVVIHLAGLSNDPMADYNPQLNFDINSKGTERLVKLCKKKKIKRFIFSSSASIYYHQTKTMTSIQDEESLVNPLASYSQSKLQAEKYILKAVDSSFCPIIFRQGTVFGFSYRMRYDLVINAMIKSILADNKIYIFCQGQQWRPLISINDVIKAYIKAINIPLYKVRQPIINLCLNNYQIIDIAYKVKKIAETITKKSIKIIFDQRQTVDRSYRIDNTKIKKILNWTPDETIEHSVKDLIKQIAKHQYNDFENSHYYNIDQWKKFLTK